jgi:predicted glutamine amidotransferase
MCRWLAYSGAPIALSKVLFDLDHSLIDQSLSARRDIATTNGDGFGVGWYGDADTPGLYRHVRPAWNDQNLRDLATHIRSHMFMAHVRAATGTAVQRSNCHPFRHGRWTFVHNGRIREFSRLRRDLTLAVPEDLFPEITGTTDSEVMFYLTLGFGLEEDVGAAVGRMVELVERVGRARGVEDPMQMTLGIANGEQLYGFRYSSEGSSRTLFHSKSVSALRELLPGVFQQNLSWFEDGARAIVSEPLTNLPEPWEEIPESSWVTVENGEVELRPFRPRAA